MNYIIKNCFVLLLIIGMSHGYYSTIKAHDSAHYYCTSADQRFYPHAVNLIRSILRADGKNVKEIAVFNLGFTPNQVAQLEIIPKVRICYPEMTHPDILTYFRTSPEGRYVRGWFAWKPIAIKQALEMYPYVLYLDAGMEVFRPLDDLFDYIQEHGYFLIDAGRHSIEQRITKYVIDTIVSELPTKQQKLIMDPHTWLISAGIQGLTRRVYQSYVFPVYKYTSDLRLFEDDGSAHLGFGAGRHDQVLFSIHAYLNNMNIFSEGWIKLSVNSKNVPIHMHWNRHSLNRYSLLFY